MSKSQASDRTTADRTTADRTVSIEEIEVEPVAVEPEGEPVREVKFVLDSLEHSEAEGSESEEDEEYPEDELTTAVGQLTQLMMTEHGEAITDVLNGLRDAMDKQNKILYRGLQLLESRFGRRP